MSDSQRPNLTLGQPPESSSKRNRFPRAWLWLSAALHGATLACLAALLWRAGPTDSPVTDQTAGGVAEWKAVAMQLENKSLDAQAAQAWKAYLAAAPSAEDRAEVLYRIGRLYLQADQPAEAAAALVRSELAAGDDSELKAKIGPQLVECLRREGLYGEVGRELSRRVEAGGEPPGGARVLATLAGDPLTEADLDRMIERRVDRMLSLQGASGDRAARDAILRQFSSPAMREQLLHELLRTELFCRRARELKLDQEEEYLRARQFLEQDLTAGRFLARQLEKIQPTGVDLESYYQAHRQQYQEPESIEVTWFPLGPEEDPGALLKEIESTEDFRKLAEGRQPDGGEADQGAATRLLIRGRNDSVLGGTDALFELAEGQWTRQPLVHGNARYLVLVEKKTPARTPSLAEVESRVQADYLARKRQELSEQLLQDLMTRYDVRIMTIEETTDSEEQGP
ncbi:MAG: peptidyl-prolyl cis-trans isomerase [Pirellulales bacterium]|nr:peptidyl-prolyl cis-trans isomerase [Pirellulales bacterium]